MKARLLVPYAARTALLLCALATGWPVTALAQDTLPPMGTLWIGIKTDTTRLPLRVSGDTALVIRVTGIQQGGPADLGGVLLGDLLVAVNGRALADYEAWLSSVATLEPGQQAQLRLNRGGTEVEAIVIVADQRPPTFSARLDLPEEVDAAWTEVRHEFEAVLEVLPDTVQSRLGLLNASFRAHFDLDSGTVSLTVNDSSVTVDIRGSAGSRTGTRPAPLPGEPGTTGRLAPAGREGAAGGSTAEQRGIVRLNAGDSVLLPLRGMDSVLAGSRLAGPDGLIRGQADVVLVGSVILGGAQVRTLPTALESYFGVPSGVLILDVLPDSPARRAGFRPGDVIVAVGGRELATLAQLRSDLDVAELPVGLTVVRHGERLDISYPAR